MTVAAGPCPNHETRACLDHIRTAIDRFDYAKARDAAALQCYAEPAGNAHGRVAVQALVTTVSGCHYLFTLERFLGNGLKAVEAREKARQIAAWGCQAGFSELCEAQFALLNDAWLELLADVEDEAQTVAATTALWQSTALRQFDTGRYFPKSFVESMQKSLTVALQRATGKPVLTDCGKTCQTRDWLDVRIALEGGGLTLSLRLMGAKSQRVLWEKSYRSRDIAERQRLFGFATLIPEGPLANRTIDAYEPSYKVLFGLGAAYIPNTSGRGAHRERLVLEIRSVERYNDRRNEFGLLLAAHMTRRSLTQLRPAMIEDAPPAATEGESKVEIEVGVEVGPFKGSDNPNRQDGEPTIVPPYERGYGLYAIYNRMFFSGRETYESLRPSLNLGLGGWASGFLIAPSARVGADLYIGRRFALTAAWLYISKTTAIMSGYELKVPAVQGMQLGVALSL